MRKKFTKGVTPVGELLFPHLRKTEEYDGKDTNKYTVMVKLNEKDKAALLKQIDAEWTKYVSDANSDAYGKSLKYDFVNGLKTTKQGDEVFKFKMSHIIDSKKGRFELHVPIFDADCREISSTVPDIGNGTKARIAYELSPYYMNPKNYGVSLRLTGVQILDLVEYGNSSPDALGFAKEDGFTQDGAENQLADDVPFADSSQEPEDF